MADWAAREDHQIDHHLVFSGPPGAGKTTLASATGARMGVPVLSKDLLKEAMAPALHDGSPASSLRLSVAAIDLLYAIAAESGTGVVLEANWRPDLDVPRLRGLGRPLVEVHCNAPVDIRRQRLTTRVSTGERHGVHRDVIDRLVLAEAISSVSDVEAPLGIGARLLRLDTSTATSHVDVLMKWLDAPTGSR